MAINVNVYLIVGLGFSILIILYLIWRMRRVRQQLSFIITGICRYGAKLDTRGNSNTLSIIVSDIYIYGRNRVYYSIDNCFT